VKHTASNKRKYAYRLLENGEETSGILLPNGRSAFGMPAVAETRLRRPVVARHLLLASHICNVQRQTVAVSTALTMLNTNIAGLRKMASSRMDA
jgi:hypothetical protein